jgi:hypothetical protein
MNRCTAFSSHRALQRLALAGAALLLSASAFAQGVRPFPPDALRGTLQVMAAPDVLLNGKPERLSPGARIRGTNNMLVLSAGLTGQSLLVHYTLEPAGLVHDVWILTPAEVQTPLPPKS